MRSVDKYAGNDLLYLNTKGIIPSLAVLKKGEQRSNPFKEVKRFDATTFPAAGETAIVQEQDEEGEEEVLDKAKLADMEG